MKKKLEMTMEVLLPTSVTQVIEFPLFVKNKTERKNYAVCIRSAESKYAPFGIVEIVEYADNRLRIYDKVGTERDVSEIISHIHTEDSHYISEQEFWTAYANAVDSYINISNEFKQKI